MQVRLLKEVLRRRLTTRHNVGEESLLLAYSNLDGKPCRSDSALESKKFLLEANKSSPAATHSQIVLHTSLQVKPVASSVVRWCLHSKQFNKLQMQVGC